MRENFVPRIHHHLVKIYSHSVRQVRKWQTFLVCEDMKMNSLHIVEHLYFAPAATANDETLKIVFVLFLFLCVLLVRQLFCIQAYACVHAEFSASSLESHNIKSWRVEYSIRCWRSGKSDKENVRALPIKMYSFPIYCTFTRCDAKSFAHISSERNKVYIISISALILADERNKKCVYHMTKAQGFIFLFCLCLWWEDFLIVSKT